MGLQAWRWAPACVIPVYSLLLEESGWVIAHLTLRQKKGITIPGIPLEFIQVYPPWPLEEPVSVGTVGTVRTTERKLLTKQNTFIWSVEPEWKWPVGCIIEQGRD